ncbi:MAG: tRNA (adenosine(37)-N6)-threonylcarbamoyltransferase complex transferase subunit TsaD [Christensenellales bacterium]
MNAFLGIDTSCYTTSAALVDDDGILIKEYRKGLSVNAGERGLRQSEALFQHLKNLPQLLQELMQDRRITAVCASAKPRPQEGSYMPVFLAGESFARTIAAAAHIPFYETTHQEGHLFAAKYESELRSDTYLAMHLSGGTTELIIVQEEKDATRIERLGGSSDVYAGQFIDRIGTAMGLDFPCGKALSEMALMGSGALVLPSAVKGLACSFSGAETRAYAACANKEETAYAVLDCIVRTIYKMITEASKETGITQALLFGGVAESTFIRERLIARIQNRRDKLEVFFAKPTFSADNALGVALAARRFYSGRVE